MFVEYAIETTIPEEIYEKFRIITDKLIEKNMKYKLVLTGSHPCPHAINIAELLASLKNKLYFVKLKNQIKAQIDLETLASEPSLKGIFVKNMLNRIENATEDEKSIFTEALYLGLEAFDTEVSYCED
jgi:hypothetical protein